MPTSAIGSSAATCMYRDLTENKPPLGYWLYTLAVALGGYNELTIRLHADPVRPGDDRAGLVDRAAARRAGRGLPRRRRSTSS